MDTDCLSNMYFEKLNNKEVAELLHLFEKNPDTESDVFLDLKDCIWQEGICNHDFYIVTPQLIRIAANIDFSVSKGTYIRSLARDIAYECGSAAHLTGLYRTKVGNFNIEDSAGFNLLKDFSIEEAIIQAKAYKAVQAAAEASASHKAEKKPERKPFILTPEESALQEEIRKKLRFFDKATAAECGFESINIASTSAQEDFFNGKKITSSMFTQKLWDYPAESQIAVFNENKFLGLIYKDQQGRPGYKFVLN